MINIKVFLFSLIFLTSFSYTVLAKNENQENDSDLSVEADNSI